MRIIKSVKKLFWGTEKLIKTIYTKIVTMRGTPEEIARGFALGVFIGMTPTLGFQTAIAAFIATLLKQNIIATALSVWITNAFTFIPIYTFNYSVGRFLLNRTTTPLITSTTFTSMKSLFNMGWGFFYTLWFGSIAVGIISSFATYYISVPLIRKWQIKKEQIKEKIKKKLHETSK
jgi:uncharacterized protein